MSFFKIESDVLPFDFGRQLLTNGIELRAELGRTVRSPTSTRRVPPTSQITQAGFAWQETVHQDFAGIELPLFQPASRQRQLTPHDVGLAVDYQRLANHLPSSAVVRGLLRSDARSDRAEGEQNGANKRGSFGTSEPPFSLHLYFGSIAARDDLHPGVRVGADGACRYGNHGTREWR